MAEGASVWQSGNSGELAWLYNADVEGDVLDAIRAETRTRD
jgi:hypothetical protein